MPSCRSFFIFILLPALVSPAHAQQISLNIEDISSPAFQAWGIYANLDGDSLEAHIDRLSFQGHLWKNVRLTCPKVSIERDSIACDKGVLKEAQSWPIRFAYVPGAKHLSLDLYPSAGEHWHAEARWGERWDIRGRIKNGHLARFKPWLPQSWPAPAGGSVSGDLYFAGKGGKLLAADADLHLNDLAFSDASGLHAGEKVSAGFRLQARQAGAELVWQGAADWSKGGIYWHPLYLTGGGARLSAKGRLSTDRIVLNQASLHLPDIGDIAVEGTWDRRGNALIAATVKGSQLNLGPLHAGFIRPFLEKTTLAKSDAAGKISFDGRFEAGEVQSIDLAIANGSLLDKEARFELRGVNLDLPWQAQSAATARLGIGSGRLLSLPLGAIQTAIQVQGKTIAIPRLLVPVLDGTLNIQDFHAEQTAAGWQWQFEGGVTPISMERLSSALRWPKMHGTLSGVVPRVHYGAGTVAVDGALLIRAFDGTAVIQDLVLLDALGRAPRLQAGLDMRNLDLDLLTRTFSFGSMLGRVDVAVMGLELSNWKPVAFDAAIRSSAGEYPRKISQRAVQNISSLGGAGAAAAIQRSFLGFFEEFGYSRLGLSCVLRNGICRMDGVEAAPNGYVIVKGGGIPAITVIGYNRSVGWEELIARLQRVTQGNAKPVVQ